MLKFAQLLDSFIHICRIKLCALKPLERFHSYLQNVDKKISTGV